MARYTGKDLVIQWIYTGGTVELNADYRSLKTSEESDAADSTAGADTYKQELPTQVDASAELEMLDTSGATGTAQWSALAPQTEGTLVWSPQGTATGKPKHSAPAMVKTRERDIPYDDVVAISVNFRLQDMPTDAAWGA